MNNQNESGFSAVPPSSGLLKLAEETEDCLQSLEMEIEALREALKPVSFCFEPEVTGTNEAVEIPRPPLSPLGERLYAHNNLIRRQREEITILRLNLTL